MAGSVRGRCPISLRRGFIFAESLLLQKGEGDHREQRVVTEAAPRAALEVVEAEFFLQLLVGLLARPAGLDSRDDGSERGALRVIGDVVLGFVFSPFAHEPDFTSR